MFEGAGSLVEVWVFAVLSLNIRNLVSTFLSCSGKGNVQEDVLDAVSNTFCVFVAPFYIPFLLSLQPKAPPQHNRSPPHPLDILPHILSHPSIADKRIASQYTFQPNASAKLSTIEKSLTSHVRICSQALTHFFPIWDTAKLHRDGVSKEILVGFEGT